MMKMSYIMSENLHTIYERTMPIKGYTGRLLTVTNTKIVQLISANIVKNMIETWAKSTLEVFNFVSIFVRIQSAMKYITASTIRNKVSIAFQLR